MEARKLRISEDKVNIETDQVMPDVETSRALRIKNTEILDKIDRLSILSERLSAKKAELKKETDSLSSEVDRLKQEILTYASENKLSELRANSAVATFSSGISRSVDAKKLLKFLSGLGRAQDFYSFVDVRIGDVTKNFGEVVLESAGVLDVNVKQYSSIKVKGL